MEKNKERERDTDEKTGRSKIQIVRATNGLKQTKSGEEEDHTTILAVKKERGVEAQSRAKEKQIDNGRKERGNRKQREGSWETLV